MFIHGGISMTDKDTNNLPYHRKYRPQAMIGYLGNTKVKETLMSVLKEGNKRPQTILLQGESGCGKTSLARLIAKEYSCTGRNSATGACGVCENCKALSSYIVSGDTSNLVNVHEVDIADQSGKNDLSDILEDMLIPTFEDEWKIYILDEVHMASLALQNRLLKIAEEPPVRVLLIFCTTRPDKILDTLKNRCQLTLKITKPKLQELRGLLKFVCDKENIEYDTAGLNFIANRSELVIRTALQYLQQVVDEQNSAKYEFVTKVFEEVSDRLIVDLLRALKNRDTFRYITTLNEIKSKVDLSLFINQLKDFIRRGVYTINGITLEGISDNELAVYRDLFGDLGIDKISNLLRVLLNLDVNNLELELIMLGYSGLDSNDAGDKTSVTVKPIENELVLEEKNAEKTIEKKAEVSIQQAIANTEKGVKEASLSAILAMGGTLID